MHGCLKSILMDIYLSTIYVHNSQSTIIWGGCMENPERRNTRNEYIHHVRIRSVRRVRITVRYGCGAWDKNAHAQLYVISRSRSR